MKHTQRERGEGGEGGEGEGESSIRIAHYHPIFTFFLNGGKSYVAFFFYKLHPDWLQKVMPPTE